MARALRAGAGRRRSVSGSVGGDVPRACGPRLGRRHPHSGRSLVEMTAKQGSIADWEVPAGGLAEEVAAPQPPREERTSIDDVEFFFLMDDEPKIAIHQEQQEETAPPTDFLFPFDQQFGRAPSVSAGSFLEGDIAAA